MRLTRLSGSTLLIALLSTLCICLLYTNVRLTATAKQLEAREQSVNTGKGPVVGSHIRSLGNTSTLIPSSLGDHGALGSFVLVFSPDCRYCKANVSNWNTLTKKHPDLQVLIADLTGDPQKRGLTGMAIPSNAVMVTLKSADQILYNLRVTPTTLILDRNGIVKGSWAGILSSADLTQMEASVQLLQSTNHTRRSL